MNTLKPLLIVAVLAGIGYGVYIRLNRGNGAPPPPVEEGWDTTPNVQLPGQSGGAPWSPPTAEVPGSALSGPAPAATTPTMETGGATPDFHPPPTTPGQAPPFGAAEAPPYASTEAPPYAADPSSDAPGAPLDSSVPPSASPNEYPPPGPGGAPPAATMPGGPLVDPYAESHDAGAAGPYSTPPSDGSPPSAYPPPAGDAAPGQAAPASGGSDDFAAAFESAQRELEGGQMAEALRHLSQWYDRPELLPDEQQQLKQLLDRVAGTVVYSTQNLIEPPYEVQPGERLEDIGEKYGVPWQLLAKVNGIDDPATLRPGERLKVIRGPFQAVVSLEKRELTLFSADGSYAGRFKIGVGGEHPPREGTFAVAEKVANPVYYGRERSISAEDAANPLGERWIGLGSGVGIHGTNDPQSIGRTDLPGSISLSERDVEDVYDILSLGSRVTIRR